VVQVGGLDRAVLGVAIACLVESLTETYRQSMGPLVPRGIASVALLPVSALLFCFIIARATAIALATGTVTWRDTDYGLAELRAQSGLEGAPPLLGRAR